MGAVFAGSMPEVGLGGAFGFFMVAMGAVIWKKGLNHKSLAGASKKAAKFRTKTRITSATLVLGFVVGIMTGSSAQGAGA